MVDVYVLSLCFSGCTTGPAAPILHPLPLHAGPSHPIRSSLPPLLHYCSAAAPFSPRPHCIPSLHRVTIRFARDRASLPVFLFFFWKFVEEIIGACALLILLFCYCVSTLLFDVCATSSRLYPWVFFVLELVIHSGMGLRFFPLYSLRRLMLWRNNWCC